MKYLQLFLKNLIDHLYFLWKQKCSYYRRVLLNWKRYNLRQLINFHMHVPFSWFQKILVSNIKKEVLRTVAQRCEYFCNTEEFRLNGYLILYLGEAWLGYYDTLRINCLNDNDEFISLKPSWERKKVVTCNAGNTKGW